MMTRRFNKQSKLLKQFLYLNTLYFVLFKFYEFFYGNVVRMKEGAQFSCKLVHNV